MSSEAGPPRSDKSRFAVRLAAWLLPAALIAVPAIAADGAGRPAVIVSQDLPQYEQALAGLLEGLGGVGRTAGPTGPTVHRLRGDPTAVAGVLAQVRSDRAPIILTLGALATRATLEAVHDLPVVAGMILRTEDLGGAANATGVLLEFPVETEIRWIHDAMPGRRDVGVLFSDHAGTGRIDEAARAAQRLGLRLHARRIESPRDLPGALERLVATTDVLWALPDPLVLTPETARPILLESFRNRIPMVGLSETWVKAGALYALDRDYRDIGRQCGEMAVRVLQGRAPSSLPPDRPRKIVYAVNLRTARHLKLELPEDFVKGAEAVID